MKFIKLRFFVFDNLTVAPAAERTLMAAFIDSNLSSQWDADEKCLVETELAITDASGKTYKVKTDALGLFKIPFFASHAPGVPTSCLLN